MNTGIQDMINLAWKLAMVYKGIAKPELLDTYEQERLPLIRGIVSMTERATDLLDSESRWTQLLVTHIAPLALGSNMISHKSASILSQVEGNYRESALSAPSGRLGDLRVGDRLPPDMFAVEGGSQTLLAALSPDRFTLLHSTGKLDQALGPLPRQAVEPVPVSLGPREALSGDADAILVRPDGYIAWMGKQDQQEELTGWGRTWFHATSADALPTGATVPRSNLVLAHGE